MHLPEAHPRWIPKSLARPRRCVGEAVLAVEEEAADDAQTPTSPLHVPKSGEGPGARPALGNQLHDDAVPDRRTRIATASTAGRGHLGQGHVNVVVERLAAALVLEVAVHRLAATAVHAADDEALELDDGPLPYSSSAETLELAAGAGRHRPPR
jgi:hypothetical protein